MLEDGVVSPKSLKPNLRAIFPLTLQNFYQKTSYNPTDYYYPFKKELSYSKIPLVFNKELTVSQNYEWSESQVDNQFFLTEKQTEKKIGLLDKTIFN